jgi:ribonuclease HII
MDQRTNNRGPDLLAWEKGLWQKNYTHLAGIDEAGRGALAGPVVAAAVVIGPDARIVPGVNDSKKLTPRKRETLYDQIKATVRTVGVGMVYHQEIDEINIYQATKKAMQKAVAGLAYPPDYLLIDGMELPECPIAQVKIIDGDALSYCIAAASIIAKVTRDRLMCEFDKVYPDYGFARHKGYGTKDHMAALAAHQPCAIHRRTFYPVSTYA